MDPMGRLPDPSMIVESLRVGFEHDLADEFLRRFDIQVTRERLMDVFRFRVRTAVFGQRLPTEHVTHDAVWHETRWATWWDHFKDTYRQRWWLRALVRRHPVRYVSIPHTRKIELTVEAYRKYPEAKLRIPEDLGPVVYQVDTWTAEQGWYSP